MNTAQIDVFDYTFNHFRTKRLADDIILLATDNGSWAALNDKQHALVKKGEIERESALAAMLEDRQIILTKRNMPRVASETRERFSYVTLGPTLHIISPTARCNHSCVYCHAKSIGIDAHGADMDEETAKATVDFIMQAPSQQLKIEFQGGEPLAVFDTVKFTIDYAKKRASDLGKQVSFCMVSNLSLLDEDKLDFLIENKVGLCTSLDGPKEVHDKNRPLNGASSYEKVTHWIDVIKNQRKYELNALPTITRHSLAYPEEIVDEYRKWGFGIVRIRQLNNAGFAAQRWNQIGYSAEEFIPFWKTAFEYSLELNRKGKDIKEGIAALFAERILSRGYAPYTCLGMPCGAVLSQAAYNHKGDIYSCDEARSFEVFKIGDVRSTFKDVFSSEAALEVVDFSTGFSSICDECVWRPYCVNCVLCNYGEFGSPVAKTALSMGCKIRAAMIEEIFRKIVAGGKDAEILRTWCNGTIR